jgi:hypothetical protein
MSDEQYKLLHDIVKTNIAGDKGKDDQFSSKALLKYSIGEITLAKFIFKFRSKEYELSNIFFYLKDSLESDNSSDGVYESIKKLFDNLKLELEAGPLYFYYK